MRAHRGGSQGLASWGGPASGRGRASGRASRTGTASLVGAGAAGLLVIAGCSGPGPAALGPPPKVTIVSGNLTFSSAANGAGRLSGPAHRAGDAIIEGLSGSGRHGAVLSHIIRTGGARIASGRSSGSRGVPGQGAPAPVDLRPDLGVRVAVQDGALTGVSVRPVTEKTAGQTLAGTYTPGSRSWRTRWALAPARTYRVTATAVDADGHRTVMTSVFRALRARWTFSAATILGAGETVGVGMPIMINFSRPITDKAAVERDYVHSAPWSVADQGSTNVSHGCVNVAPGYAAWFYGRSVLGDPISVVGSPVAGTWGDGWTIYFLGWRKLLAGSATGDAVLAGRDGSQLVAASSGPRLSQ